MKTFKQLVIESSYDYEKDLLKEAISIEYDRYIRSHGKKPKGGSNSGNWMFTNKNMGDVDFKNDKECFEFRGTLKDAQKAAKAWGKKNGHHSVYVME